MNATDHEPVRIATPQELYTCVRDLYPMCRSLTGDGVRQTLAYLQQLIPLQIRSVASGTAVYDWRVPDEWNVREAWIADSAGRRVVDFARHNLHLVSYSRPARARLTLAELRPHLHSLPDQPDRIPYRTGYYSDNWGFCLPHRLLESLAEGEYEVCVDTTLAPGELNYGELLIPGQSEREVLLSCHICHPSLANDNLSAIAVAAHLARELLLRSKKESLRYSYRLLFSPATIGPLTWLAANDDRIPHIAHGLVLSCLGDRAPFTYKRSRRGDSEIDRIVGHVLRCSDSGSSIDFSPYGYDERQYCSPGFNLPMGRLTRGLHGEFPEYHTDADNLDFVRGEHLEESLQVCREIVGVLERNQRFISTRPYGEPQLGRRGLYDPIGGVATTPEARMALLWLLNFADGEHDLLAVAERAGLEFDRIAEASSALLDAGVLRPAAARETLA